jgi:hypothetical protein
LSYETDEALFDEEGMVFTVKAQFSTSTQSLLDTDANRSGHQRGRRSFGNAELHARVLEFLEQVLLTAHAKHPIEGVEIVVE